MRILIGIASSHTETSALRRKAQRDTWVRNVHHWEDDRFVTARFFIGFPRPDFSRSIVCRSGQFASAEMWCVYLACPDDYHNLTLKTAAMIRYAIEGSFDFLFKCDDDTYVRPERLLTSGFEEHDYIGWTKDRPYAQGGAGYWLSRRALEILDKESLRHHSEDAAVGLALAKHGILPLHDERYQPGLGTAESTAPLSSNNIITLHNCRPDPPVPPSERAGIEHSATFRRSMYDVDREFWVSVWTGR